MPGDYTANWSPFPPETREVPCDEKWAFVGKKEQHCDLDDPHDQRQGDNWDHVAYDPEHRLVLAVAPGKRTAEKAGLLLQDLKRRLRGRIPNLITTDNCAAYRNAILQAYGEMWCPSGPASRGVRGVPTGCRRRN
jgi:IS1 family transposase